MTHQGTEEPNFRADLPANSNELGVDKQRTQDYTCVEMFTFENNGNLTPGLHEATWGEFQRCFGTTTRRQELLVGLKAALDVLMFAGCKRIYVGGSFATKKLEPGDTDVCWDPEGVDLDLLFQAEPLFWDFTNKRRAQKDKYLGEFFLSSMMETDSGKVFLDFFQQDKDTGEPKGIVVINLERQ